MIIKTSMKLLRWFLPCNLLSSFGISNGCRKIAGNLMRLVVDISVDVSETYAGRDFFLGKTIISDDGRFEWDEEKNELELYLLKEQIMI